MILHLIRHAKPVIEEGICYGRLDIEAENTLGVADHLRNALPPGLPVWSSPLRRCLALAEALHPRLLLESPTPESSASCSPTGAACHPRRGRNWDLHTVR